MGPPMTAPKTDPSPLVEVVARALYENGGYGTVSWDEVHLAGEAPRFLRMARAALSAIEKAGYVVVARHETP